jgi:small subunit ribosomal protein S8e
MARWHGEKGRKLTGGKINLGKGKRKYEMGNLPLHTKLGKEEIKIVKVKGGDKKVKAASVEFANVISDKETKKVKILDISGNPADPHLARRGIITKGSILKTELGLVKVTSRPSQHGIVNAILVKEK